MYTIAINVFHVLLQKYKQGPFLQTQYEQTI